MVYPLYGSYSVESIILDEEAQFIHEVGSPQLNHIRIRRDGPDINMAGYLMLKLLKNKILGQISG